MSVSLLQLWAVGDQLELGLSTSLYHSSGISPHIKCNKLYLTQQTVSDKVRQSNYIPGQGKE